MAVSGVSSSTDAGRLAATPRLNLSLLKRQNDALRAARQKAKPQIIEKVVTKTVQVGIPPTPQQAAITAKLNAANRMAAEFIKVNDTLTALSNPSLTAPQRQTLQNDITGFLAQIDTISQQANFSTGTAADGALVLFDKPEIITRIEPPLSFNQTASTRGQARLNFTAQPTNGQTVRVNGVTLTASTTLNTGTNFQIGATLDATLTNLAARLNAQTSANLTRVSFAKDGSTGILITSRIAGNFGEDFVIDDGVSTAPFTVTGDLIGANRYTLDGAVQGAGSGGDVRVRTTGAAANTLLAATTNTLASATLTFANATNVTNGQTVSIDNGIGGTFAFTFRTAANPAVPLDVAIGATLEDSLQNMANAINTYAARSATDSDFTLRQVNFRQQGLTLVGEALYNTNPVDGGLAALDIAETTAGTLNRTTISGAATTGVLTDGISNAAFTGTISGFTATYVSANRVNLSTTIGGSTYTGTVTSTAPTAAATVRLSSTNGGFFEIQLAANGGIAVANQTAANTYAARVNAAFSNLEFSQTRTINLQNASALNGASIALRGTNFSGTIAMNGAAAGVTAAADNAGDAQIRLTLNNELFTSQAGLGTSLGAGETLRLTSATTPGRVIEYRNTAPAVSLATAQDATNFRTKLEQAFGFVFNVDPAAAGVLYGTQAAAANQNYIRTPDSNWLMGGQQLGLTPATQAADTALLQRAKSRLTELWQFLSAQHNVLNQNQNYDRYGSLTSWTNSTRMNILV